MPGSRYFGQALLDSVKSGAVSDSIIDIRVREILRVRLTVKPVPEAEANQVMTSQPEQQQIAYDIAKRSIVLLKNENKLLPIQAEKVKSIAVIGDNAVRTQALGGVGAGVKALYEVTPLAGITKQFEGSGITIKWAQGYAEYSKRDRESRVSPYTNADPKLMDEAVSLAKESDLVIFVGGNNREVETEGRDRNAITLPMGQDELLKALSAVNPNIVTVIVSGAPVDLRVVQETSPAILMSWFNGSEGGTALADVLSGEISPSGKLPFTLPIRLEDSPAYSLNVYPQEMPQRQGDIFTNLVNRRNAAQLGGPDAEYAEDIFVGYRWFDTKEVPVLYPFGHGLSYSYFNYLNLEVDMDDDNLVAEVKLRNTGKYDGEEVVQLYVRRPDSKIERPLQELKGFQRIHLQAGETGSVKIQVPMKHLRHWDEAAWDWQLEPGTVEIIVGSSSKDGRIQMETEI